jgi:hypothetical protein
MSLASCPWPFVAWPSVSTTLSINGGRHVINIGWATQEKFGVCDRGAGGAQRRRARPQAELGVGAGKGSPPSATEVRGITPGKFFKIYTSVGEFYAFLKQNNKRADVQGYHLRKLLCVKVYCSHLSNCQSLSQ